MTASPIVLIFTCSEYGQANVNIATAFELALAGVNVYISSYPSFESRVSRLQDLVVHHASRSGVNHTGSVHFREYIGLPPRWDSIGKHGVNAVSLTHPHGVMGAPKCFSMVDVACFPWNPQEHLAAIESSKEMITSIKPDVVVIDKAIIPAMDACKLLGQKFVVMLPNSIKDVVLSLQPGMASFWKYPIISSGFSYPLKWWQIPLNIYLNIRLTMYYLASERVKEVQAMRKSLGVETKYPYPGVPYICPALPETDYPFDVVPKELITCGPIVMPFDPLEQSDPDLMNWLDNGPTVVVNLGSHVVSDEGFAREMAKAFRILLEHHDRKGIGKDRMQVIWKIKASGNVRKAIDGIIGHNIEEGRVKVVAWIDAEPVSILQHPNVVCAVHHGGANSFFEAVWSGKPHLVLPVWFDTYEYAVRAEFLNIGIFGNQSCAPGVRAKEFGPALIKITGDTEEARKFGTAAKRLQEICREAGNGRELAATAILKEIGIAD